ncbi:acyltransferase family protein [Streptomyces sp. NPDC051940]|uniref:acyltransferase family protein n=1 Tax=Streptomyces sp. NPDC051940 TaxID=3155675 RepID=UPI00343CA92B
MTNSPLHDRPPERNSAPPAASPHGRGGTALQDRPPQQPHGPGAPAPDAEPAPARAGRDPFFDNAKYLAIVLVAVAHAWEPLREGSRTVTALYLFVYAFHMPAFIVISGFMSRGFDGSRGRVQRLVTGVLVPYFVFEFLYVLFKRVAGGEPDQPFTPLDPWYLTWFLMALFVWRLTAPLWRSVRWPVPVALGVAMLATLSPELGDGFDVQRILQFLPFFVLGLRLRPEHFELLRHRTWRLASVPVAAAGLLAAYWAEPRMTTDWLYHRDSARELDAAWWAGIPMTLCLFAVSLTLTACFLAWIPRRRTWFTPLGAGTLYGYLLHGFLVKGAGFWGWYDPPWTSTPTGALLISALAATAVTLLCTAPVRRAFHPLVEPRLNWAFQREPTRSPSGV